ncbi:MAG: galactitol-1-phosphate 5-dehydrogenase [Lachnospiraceae bacterium]|nr:galactitol-1-phosphate 5-dehydrogenase [Lachnospiraceae bacterium]
MKAWMLKGIGNIEYQETEEPRLNEGEVLVRVKAAGICGSDIPRVFKNGAHKMPLIIGHEFSGDVVETGKNTDKIWLNKRVGIFPLIPCGKCDLCKSKRFELCRNYNYLGSRCDGGFARFVAVPESNLIEIPDNVLYEQAAMLEPMAVAVHAIRRVMADTDNDLNKTVAVYGLGTIGMLVTMFLKEAGFERLILIGNKDSARDRIIKMGIPEPGYYDIRDDKVIEKIKEKNGADIVFECVGKPDTLENSIDIAAPLGSVVAVGNPYSDMMLKRNVYWKILRNELKIMGTWNSSFIQDDEDDWHYVMERLSNGRISPEMYITHKLDLKNLRRGLDIMHEKSEDYLKIMVNEF